MAYDTDLADRLRHVLAGERGLAEKRMFGGLGFLVDGRLAVSASSRGGLLVRAEPAATEALLSEPGVSRFVMRGREMAGWLAVEAAAVGSEADLRRWVTVGLAAAGAAA